MNPKDRRAAFLGAAKSKNSPMMGRKEDQKQDKVTKEWEEFEKPKGVKINKHNSHEFDLSYNLDYGFWHNCNIVFHIKITDVEPSLFTFGIVLC